MTNIEMSMRLEGEWAPMLKTTLQEQEFFTRHGVMSDPGRYANLLQDLPSDLPGLVQTVQGLLVHIFWAERHGLKLSEQRQAEVQIRPVERKITRILELDERPLGEARPLEKRLVGNCRDYSLLLCSMLKQQGVPARARCGFGAYFLPDHYEDHWVCEYWNPGEGRWIMVDSQLNDLQKEVLQTPFDNLDVPHDQFLTGGKAWGMARREGYDPEKFGIFDMHGLWFIRGDLIRDFLSLNRFEILPWDHWGLMDGADEELSPEDWELLDHLADITIPGQEDFAEIRRLYADEPRLRIPEGWQV
jgi:hypothetical protein